MNTLMLCEMEQGDKFFMNGEDYTFECLNDDGQTAKVTHKDSGMSQDLDMLMDVSV